MRFSIIFALPFSSWCSSAFQSQSFSRPALVVMRSSTYANVDTETRSSFSEVQQQPLGPPPAPYTVSSSPLALPAKESVPDRFASFDYWEEVQDRMKLCDQGDTGTPRAQYSGFFSPVPPRALEKRRAAPKKDAVSRWEEVEQRMFICDEGDTGAPAGLYYSTPTPNVPVALERSTRRPQGDYWEEVQQRMKICDEGDTGAARGQYSGSFTPVPPKALEKRRTLPSGGVVSRWEEVEQRMFICDEGDTGAPAGLYYSTTTPSVPVAPANLLPENKA